MRDGHLIRGAVGRPAISMVRKLNSQMPIDRRCDRDIDVFERVVEDPRFLEIADEKIREQESR